MESKLRAIQSASTLLQGPCDTGNQALEVPGMMDAVIALCASKDVGHQQVAVEALIHASGKAKRASFITPNGVALLKDLYKNSENDRIRVRALVVRDRTAVAMLPLGLSSSLLEEVVFISSSCFLFKI